MTPKLILVFGTRPELIKVAPIVWQFEARGLRGQLLVIHTNQHGKLVKNELHTFRVQPDVTLAAPTVHCPPEKMLAYMLEQLSSAISHATTACRPVAVLAQGDTTSVLAASLAAFYRELPFLHLEAGLRTNSLSAPFPEEGHRRLAAAIAHIHFAPTFEAVANLKDEGVAESRILLTGNTIIDCMQHFLPQSTHRINRQRNVVLITIHRRENHPVLPQVFGAVVQLANAHPALDFVWLAHPNPAITAFFSGQHHETAPNFSLRPPQSYPQMMQLYSKAALIITDSGGVQEEASVLGIPLIVPRAQTERPENVQEGLAVCVPTEVEAICKAFKNVLEAMPVRPHQRFGDGTAAIKVVNWIEENLLQPSAHDPHANAHGQGSCAQTG